MSEIAVVKLSDLFTVEPAELIVAKKKVPVDERGYIPLRVLHRSFDIVEPVLQQIGGGAVSMSLGRPFGFARNIGGPTRTLESQQTNGIIIAPVFGQEDRWMASFETPEPLTRTDIALFDRGVWFYAANAKNKLG